jgi:D-aspartate ligase
VAVRPVGVADGGRAIHGGHSISEPIEAGNTESVGALVYASSYTALGIVRSLGRHNIPVWVLGDRFSLAGASRYAKRTITIQGEDEAAQADFLINLAQEHHLEGWALFPDSDKTVALIAHHHQALSKYYKLASPDWDVAQWAIDKHLTYQLAEELGIAYPRTFYPASAADVRDLDGNFPMILKPSNHEGSDAFSIISGAWRADNREELLQLYDKASDAVANRPVVTVQEMIPGGGEAQFSYAALCDDGQVLASVFAQRKRLLPVDFGASAYAQTIEPIPEIEDASRRWLERANFNGLVEVEFKFHSALGTYLLLDVNARAWGWHALCAYAGVDFPYLAWRLVQGEEIPPARGQAGVRWVRTPYDLMSALQLVRRGTLRVRDYFESLRGAHHEMYTPDDLAPAIVEIPVLLKLAWNRLRGR